MIEQESLGSPNMQETKRSLVKQILIISIDQVQKSATLKTLNGMEVMKPCSLPCKLSIVNTKSDQAQGIYNGCA